MIIKLYFKEKFAEDGLYPEPKFIRRSFKTPKPHKL